MFPRCSLDRSVLHLHLHLRRYVVIELKPGEFEPEYAGKMNFYLSLVDAQLCHPTDAPSIGMVYSCARAATSCRRVPTARHEQANRGVRVFSEQGGGAQRTRPLT